jgi:hypothetical protein
MYAGLLGRVLEPETRINSYRKGEPLNAKANVVLAGDATAPYATLTTIFYTSDGGTQVATKEIPIPATTQGADVDIDFQDIKAAQKMLVEKVEFVLESSEGVLLDRKTVTLDTDQIFAYEKEFPKGLVSIFGILLLLGILLIAIYTNKKTKHLHVALLVMCVGVAGFIFMQPDNASADAVLSPSNFGGSVGIYDPGCESFNDCPDEYDIDGDSNNTEVLPSIGLDGSIMSVWEDPAGDNVPSGDQGICAGQCEDVIYWVKIQCKQCANDPRSITVNYFNNWTDNTIIPDETYTLNTSTGYYNSGTQSAIYENEEDAALNEGENVDFWIYGPFSSEFCFQDEGIEVENGMCTTTDAVNPATGKVSQEYNIQVSSQFGEGYCAFSYSLSPMVESEDVQSLITGIEDRLNQIGNTITLNNVHEVTCDAPGCIKGSLFFDTNQDGVRQAGENYIGPEGSSSAWGGIEANVYGKITGTGGTFSQLSASFFDTKPYFIETYVAPGLHDFFLDATSPSDWEQTTGTINFQLTAGQTQEVELGVNNASPATFTCAITLPPGGDDGGGGDPDEIQQGSCSNSDWFAFPSAQYSVQENGGFTYITIPQDVGGKRYKELIQNIVDTYDATHTVVAVDNITNLVSEETIEALTNTDGVIEPIIYLSDVDLTMGATKAKISRFRMLKHWKFCWDGNDPYSSCLREWGDGYGCYGTGWARGAWCQGDPLQPYWLPYPYWHNDPEDEYRSQEEQALISQGYSNYNDGFFTASKWKYKYFQQISTKTICLVDTNITIVLQLK